MKISSFVDAVSVIPDPVTPLIFDKDFKGLLWDSSNNWSYAAAGLWEIRWAPVCRENKIGPWSLPATMDMPPGWLLFGRTVLPTIVVNGEPRPHPDIAAVVWRATELGTGKQVWLVEGQRSGYAKYDQFKDCFDSQAPFPWSSNNPDPYPLTMHDRGNASKPIQSSSILSSLAQPAAPQVWLCTHELKPTRIRWSWATHSGESRLSPPLQLSSVHPAGVKGMRRFRFAAGTPIPQGVLGVYLYEEFEPDVWRRQPVNPWLASTSGPDKYLHGLQDEQECIFTSDPEGPLHQGPAQGCSAWSIVSPLQQAMFTSSSAIEIDSPDPHIYGPIIDPCLPNLVRNRFVAGTGLGGVTVEQRATVPSVGDNYPQNNHPTYWPAIIEMCDELQGTTWHGISFKADMSRGPGLSCWITSCDFSGGQAYNVKLRNCVISLGTRWAFPFVKEGIHVGWETASQPGQHTASEWVIEDCLLYGDTAVRLEGTQSVNFRFRNCHLLGLPAAEIIVDGGEAVFDGLVASRFDKLLSAGWIANVRINGLFSDQASHALVDFNSYQPGKVIIDRASLRGINFVCRSPIAVTPHALDLRDVTYQAGSEKTVLHSVSPDSLDTKMPGSAVLQSRTSVAEPTLVDFEARL